MTVLSAFEWKTMAAVCRISYKTYSFKPFVTAAKMNGLGLGLTIAEHAAREHGGSLDLEESIPGNTIFILRPPKLILESTLIEERSG
jgi:nitrogen-specific signal transduction histidine kinase